MEPFVYYLSGPMTGIPDHNFPLFDRVTKKLREYGMDVRSPHEAQNEDPATAGTTLEYWEYIKKDVQIMMDCNAIILLPGWYRSKGSRIELNLALDLNFHVFRVDDWDVSPRVVSIDEGFYTGVLDR